ncbi:hypothetical protein NPIL_656091 [Nephila pilipes]|uniref:Uncharacterized protein n=1 Tax=Nephila pilipes TaxID=299642 RepID=A0A8X6PQ13_NEPPI|nr:hypothetical protein NPIL_656091 [Nephila pilipes]
MFRIWKNKRSLMSLWESFETIEANIDHDEDVHVPRLQYVSYERAVADSKLLCDPHLSQKKFLDKNEIIAKDIIDEVEEEITNHLKAGEIYEMNLRGRKQKSFAAWITPRNGKVIFEIDESFLREFRRENDLKVTALTIVSPSYKKFFQISVNEQGVRLYKVLKGQVTITFNWMSLGKKCKVTATITEKGEIFLKDFSQNLSIADVFDNRFVKIQIPNDTNDSKKEWTLINLAHKGENVRFYVCGHAFCSCSM